MCRHLAWSGEPRPQAQFVTDPPRSPVHQRHVATELRRGRVLADGFGVGWYPADHRGPARHRRAEPIRSGTDLDRLAAAIGSRERVAAVRDGTSGIPGRVASTQPVTADGPPASHNGYIADLHQHARQLRDGLAEDPYAALPGESDPGTFLLLAIDRVRREGELSAGLESAIDAVRRTAPGSSLCVLMTDGQLVAARTADGQTCEALCARRQADGGGVAPLDAEPGWTALPEFAVSSVAASAVAVDGVGG